MDKKKIHFKNNSLIFKVTLVLVNVSISRYFSAVMEEKHFFFCFKIHKNVDDPEIISEIDSLVKNQKNDLCTHSWLSIRYWKILTYVPEFFCLKSLSVSKGLPY